MKKTFPAAPGDQVTLANWREAPHSTWAFQHVCELIPSANVAHDPGAIRVLETDLMDTSGLGVEIDGAGCDLDTLLEQTHTDGLVVLHRGRAVIERYRNDMEPSDPHILMSVSKSMLGLLAGVLHSKGILDTDAPLEDYVPEISSSALAGATVRHALDMRVGVEFDEAYTATSGPIIEYRKAQGWNPVPLGEQPGDLRSFFATLEISDGPHGGRFHYVSPVTDLLGWVIERATSQPYAAMMSEHLWKHIGAELAAYITVDRLGAPRAAGGMCVTTRDLARVGQALIDGRGVPTNWIDNIETGGDPNAWNTGDFVEYFPGLDMHYRAKWYVLRSLGPVLMCLGIHGQILLVDRARDIVLAKHASHPVALDTSGELMMIELFQQIRERL